MKAEEGCTCHSCGRKYKIDFNIPNELWGKINQGKNLLCGTCIVEKLEQYLDYYAFEIIDKCDAEKRYEAACKSYRMTFEEEPGWPYDKFFRKAAGLDTPNNDEG